MARERPGPARAYSRVSVSRNLQDRRDRKTLRSIQGTLRHLDHIQTLKQMESQLLYKIYGHQADRHSYRSPGMDRAAANSELDMYPRTGPYARMSAESLPLMQLQAPAAPEESTTIQLNNILVPSTFQMAAASAARVPATESNSV